MENQRHAKFHEFRDLDYFKQFFKNSNDFQMKEILPNYVFKTSSKILDHETFIYLPQKNYDNLEMGVPIHESIKELSKKITLIKFSKHLGKILKYGLNVNVPVLDLYKSQVRFNLLYQVEVLSFPFNRSIFRKSDEFKGIFFILEGLIKVEGDQSGSNSCKNLSQGLFLGLNELTFDKSEYQSSAISHSNNTKLLFFSLSMLQAHEETKLKDNFRAHFIDVKQRTERNLEEKTKKQLNLNLNKGTNLSQKRSQQKFASIKISAFTRRLECFSENCSQTDRGFNEYVRKKKVLLKLKESVQLYHTKKSKINKCPFNSLLLMKTKYSWNGRQMKISGQQWNDENENKDQMQKEKRDNIWSQKIQREIKRNQTRDKAPDVEELLRITNRF